MRSRKISRPLLIAITLGLALPGCSALPGMVVDERAAWFRSEEVEPPEPLVPYRIVPITPETVRALYSPPAALGQTLPVSADRYAYRIQPHDILTIIVWEHPELTIPAGEFRSGADVGRLVREDGTMFFPYAGVVRVAGLTVEGIRRLLVERLDPVIQNPQVDVRIAEFRGERAYVTGQVQNPGVLPVTDVPLTVLDAINGVGGFTELADQRFAQLTRDGVRHTIDLEALYERGDLTQNYILRGADVLNVPHNLDNKVFVLGEVGQQNVVYRDLTDLTLAGALAKANGIDLDTANTTGVYVIRGSDDATAPVTVYSLDVSNAPALVLADRFLLQPRDVVFVSSAPLTRWNRVVDKILPTVQTLWQTKQLAGG